jgi:hypothetical protein
MANDQSKPEQKIFQLTLSKIETIHVNVSGQKLACVCLVAKDTPNFKKFSKKLGITERLIITDVVPQKSNPTKADLIFRNINNKETIELTQHMVLPPYTLEHVFGDIVNNSIVNENGKLEPFEVDEDELPLDEEILADAAHDNDGDDTDEDDEEYYDEDDEEYGEINFEDNQDGFQALAGVLLNNLEEIPEQNDLTSYKVTVPLVQAHIAKTLYVSSNSPAFIVISEKEYDELNAERKYPELSLDNFMLLDYPYPDTAAYFEATASLMQSITGMYQMNISTEAMGRLRGEMLSLVVKMASGSTDALVKSFSYINPIKKANSVVARRTSGDRTAKPTPNDVELCYLAEAIDRAYVFMSPSNIASIMQDDMNGMEYLQEINAVDALFAETGMNEAFNEIISEEKEKSLFNFVVPPGLNSSIEEIVHYYSSEITSENLPEAMRPLVNTINMPLLYEQDWASGKVELKDTPSNVSEIVIAKLITLAVRYARLNTIVSSTTVNINPIGCLIRGVSFPNESLAWTYTEGVRHLPEKDGEKFFTELYTAGLTKSNISPEFYDINVLLNTGLSHLLHRLGHAIIQEEWSKDALSMLTVNQTVLPYFIEQLFTTLESEVNSEGDVQENDFEIEIEEGCPSMQATGSFLMSIDFKAEGDKLVGEIAELLIELSELKASQTIENRSGSKEWKEFVQDYLLILVSGGQH